MPAEPLIDAALATRCNLLLRRAGLRVTSARRIVLALLMHAPRGQHGDAGALLRLGEIHGYPLQPSTIYRVLHDLRARGLLEPRSPSTDADADDGCRATPSLLQQELTR